MNTICEYTPAQIAVNCATEIAYNALINNKEFVLFCEWAELVDKNNILFDDFDDIMYQYRYNSKWQEYRKSAIGY